MSYRENQLPEAGLPHSNQQRDAYNIPVSRKQRRHCRKQLRYALSVYSPSPDVANEEEVSAGGRASWLSLSETNRDKPLPPGSLFPFFHLFLLPNRNYRAVVQRI